jgi:hypothetical protein
MTLLDDEDRRMIGQGVIRLVVIEFLILVGVVTAGVALRLFLLASGI